MRAYNEGAGLFNEGVARTMAPVMTALGGANVINQQARALSGQSGGGSAGFGIGGDFSASAGYGGSNVGIGGGFGGVGDLTGTGFGIQSSCGDYRAQAKKTDALLNILIMMIACGNTDAISSAFILLSQKSKQTLTQASLQMITSMRQYDNQMKGLSDQMGSLSSSNPNYQSQLAGLNGQFQMASSGRQMIMNMGRDIMSSVEEFNNLEKSVLDQLTRSRSTYARWT